MKKRSLMIACVVLIMSACEGQKNVESSGSNTSSAESVLTVSKQKAIQDYMLLKDAFVNTAVDAAKAAASQLLESLKSEGMDEATIEAAGIIAASDNIDEQRAAFKVITDNIVTTLKSSDTEAGVYVQYCPMAFDNTGASWLSWSEEIRNPYFGDKMLKCGKVQEQL